MFRFKSSSKNKRKGTIPSPTPAVQNSTDAKMLYNIPSVSQIAPLPQNKSHGILPVLSMDGRDTFSSIDLPDCDNNHASAKASDDKEENTCQLVGG